MFTPTFFFINMKQGYRTKNPIESFNEALLKLTNITTEAWGIVKAKRGS